MTNTLSLSFLICKMGYSYLLLRVNVGRKDDVQGAWSLVDTPFSPPLLLSPSIYIVLFSVLLFSHLGPSLFHCPIAFSVS